MTEDVCKLASIKIAETDYITDNVSPSYISSLLGGLDPSGLVTFDTALSEHDPSRRPTHKMLSSLGGVLGGMALIPSAVGAGVAPILGRKKIDGLKSLGKLMWAGAKAPFKRVASGTKLTRLLGKNKLESADLAEAQRLAQSMGYMSKGTPNIFERIKGSVIGDAFDSVISPAASYLSKNQRNEIRRMLFADTLSTGGAIGTGGLIGGSAALGQFSSGSKAGDRIRKEYNEKEDLKQKILNYHG